MARNVRAIIGLRGTAARAARLRAAGARTGLCAAAGAPHPDRNASLPPLQRLQPDATPTACAPVAQHRASAARATAHEKAVAPRAPRLGRLVSALHGWSECEKGRY